MAAEDIERWGRENYPRLMENRKLIESLYRRKVLNQPTSLQAVAYPLRKLIDVKPDSVVTLMVTKVESSLKTTEVCKECNKRTCEHHGERVPFYICRMIAGDDTGIETFERIGTDKATMETIEKNEEFIISGVLKVSEQFGREFYMKSFAPLNKEQMDAWSRLEEYESIHGGEAGISEEEFNKLTKDKAELLAPIFERVFISRASGRVKW